MFFQKAKESKMEIGLGRVENQGHEEVTWLLLAHGNGRSTFGLEPRRTCLTILSP